MCPWRQISLWCDAQKERNSQIQNVLRVTAGGELSTVRPWDLTCARLEGLLYGAISPPTSFSLLAAGLRGPWLNAPRSISRTLVRVLASTLHYFAAVRAQLINGLTWEVARHYNEAVGLRNINTKPVSRGRQAPLFEGFWRFGPQLSTRVHTVYVLSTLSTLLSTR
jgi:hypothetical protein